MWNLLSIQMDDLKEIKNYIFFLFHKPKKRNQVKSGEIRAIYHLQPEYQFLTSIISVNNFQTE